MEFVRNSKSRQCWFSTVWLPFLFHPLITFEWHTLLLRSKWLSSQTSTPAHWRNLSRSAKRTQPFNQVRACGSYDSCAVEAANSVPLGKFSELDIERKMRLNRVQRWRMYWHDFVSTVLDWLPYIH